MIWTLGLMGALIVPALAMALPRWEVPLVRLSTETVDAPPPAAIPAPAPPRLRITGRRRRQTMPRRAQDPPTRRRQTRALPSWSTSLLLIWSIGALLIVGRMLVGLVAVQWMSRRTALVTDAPWLAQARELARDLGLSRVRFLRTGAASMPMAWGILRPSVLMPADADSWPDERLRIVLLHELAHVKRRDCLTHLFAQLACAAYWFNPLAWMAVGRLRAERERACDDLVLAAGTRGADYANQLLEIARVMNAGRFPAVLAGASLAMAHRSQLEGRLIAILDPTVPRRGLTRLRAGVAAGVFAVVLVPVASVQPWAEERAAVKTQDVVPVPASAQTPQPLPVPAPPAEPPAPAPVPAPQPMSAKVPASEWHTAGQEMPHAVADGMAHGIGQGVAQGVSQGIATGVGTGMATAVESVVGHVTEAAAAQGEEKERAHAKRPADRRRADRGAQGFGQGSARDRTLCLDADARSASIYEPLTQR